MRAEFARCSICKLTKEAAAFFPEKEGRKLNGLSSRCKECNKLRTREWKNNHPHRRWAMSARNTHRLRFEVQFTLDWLYEKALCAPNCPWCGIVMDYNARREWNSPSLDRIWNDKVLTQDNVIIVCWRCNAAKGTDTLESYMSWLHKDRRVSNEP